MKFSTVIVSALATLVSAAPTEKRSAFDLSQLNGLNNFNQVNLNYLLNVNSLDLNLLGSLGQVNNFDILQFSNLFQGNQFDIQALLQLQQLQDLLLLGQQGLFNGFDLSSLQFGGLQLGLLQQQVGVLDLQQFIAPQVVTQVQTIASQVLPFGGGLNGVFGSGLSGGLSSGLSTGLSGDVLSGAAAPGVVSDVSGGAAVTSAPDTGVVTAAEQDAQEGSSSLP
ncbi:hypothetical protein B0H67DRAFT_251195 [Lasiosphaeris hirsuta]|uniref:Uncharacterized protein n=1 Tax=Lasiosphaeris hirsuta TaxID=260670 RepID=A0AA40AH88_9PEZI|nr:hypothetical protein B0H67DRAFT_251195 [Lasiosphaeris hirsuta]